MVKKRTFFTGVLGFRGFGVWDDLGNSGQMKIMQMSFMIIGVFFFFVLVGLFVMGIMFADVRENAEELARAQAISSIEGIAGMSELNYKQSWSMSLDEDKLRVMAGGFAARYEEFWPIASLEVYKICPDCNEIVECPASECNHYDVYDSGQRNVEKVSSYVSICKRTLEFEGFYDRCEIGKLVVGMRKNEEVSG